MDNGNEAKRFVGIDLSKRTYEAVAITVDPQTITRWNGKLDPRGRKCLVDKLSPGDIVALEADTASFKIAKEIQSKRKRKFYPVGQKINMNPAPAGTAKAHASLPGSSL